MGGVSQPRKGRKTTAKTGCHTCKTRKVKCDERRPSCRRCACAGRECEGYGVWDNFHRPSQPIGPSDVCIRVPQLRPCVSIRAAGTGEENRYLEWFMCRTAKKISASFTLNFWSKLVFQASFEEPAIMDAILTLSSVHNRERLSSTRSQDIPDDQERFMLQHYTKAISHLQYHFCIKGEASVRVALMTCVVFVCVEFLRGRFQTAQIHLENGIKVLGDLQNDSSARSSHPIDNDIFEAFSRLHIQVELFNLSHRHQLPLPVLRTTRAGSLSSANSTINEAWHRLEHIFYRIFHLTGMCRLHRAPKGNHDNNATFLGQQQQIHIELAQWLQIHVFSKKDLKSPDSDGFRLRLMLNFHAMATIMASTCHRPDDESIYDAHTEQFISIISKATEMWRVRSSGDEPPRPSGSSVDMPHSMCDLGWIPPLYYTALKCRNRRIRHQAVQLLESASHREGIWDSNIASSVARKVVEIEEKEFYRDSGVADDSSLSNMPGPYDLEVPTPLVSYRIRDVQVLLPDGPADSVVISYRVSEDDQDRKEIRVFLEGPPGQKKRLA
ncbi:C6 zinc finger domain protein [Clohesyomyces aquaticus]|uniref:C6 zinc finger domain protein n=1 Tax=Clohesyomyces aquaticus TaxID=1231657 RepID=A0A1Y1ZPT3_9PLEO|nr:C6 zinc finger domain protein [Clohesyomyces aquaticus]